MIRLSVGNIIMIGTVSALTGLAGLLIVSHLSAKDVPVLSPMSRGVIDVVHNASAAA